MLHSSMEFGELGVMLICSMDNMELSAPAVNLTTYFFFCTLEPRVK